MSAHATQADARSFTTPAWLLSALLLSAVAIADSSGLILPNTYRTPLSDVVSEDQHSWRASQEDENPWRKDRVEADSDSRFKATVLPQYDYSERDDPALRNLFMNENELARPKTNIFKYIF